MSIWTRSERPCRVAGVRDERTLARRRLLGRQVFSGGIANPLLWTNEALILDVGFNWYLNKFLKVYFDWEQAMFGSPVFSNPGYFQKSNALDWLRPQAYF